MIHGECGQACPQELASAPLYGSLPVANDELVCRGAYMPMHYNRAGTRLKAAFIEKKMLLGGELSVWRLTPVADPATLVPKLQKADRQLKAIHGLTAKEVRDLRDAELSRREFSVINDTRIDDAGGHDLQHAAIAPCTRYRKAEIAEETAQHLINRLWGAYQERIIWQAAA